MAGRNIIILPAERRRLTRRSSDYRIGGQLHDRTFGAEVVLAPGQRFTVPLIRRSDPERSE